MKVTFVALGQEQLGISMLSAVLRAAGHETSLVFDPALFHDRYYFDIPILRDLFNRDARVVDEIVAEAPDLLAFSVLTSTYTWCLQIAAEVKRRIDVPVIFGGVHPSAVPEVCLENACVDYACVGEGEQAIVELCERLDRGEHPPRRPIANLWWRGRDGELVRGPNASFIEDIDSLPFWDKQLWEGHVRLQDNYLTMMSRGCPYRCTFCFNNFFAKLPGRDGGRYVRQRSVERCMEELLLAKRRYGFRHVEITDDVFTLDKQWIKQFLARYRREIAVPFSCLVHARFIDDDLARWLRDAGCDRIQMGIQSADPEYKRQQLLRMEKDVNLHAALRAMRDAGLPMKLDHILALPGEPLRAQEMARELYLTYPPHRINTYWLTHLPGIELTKNAVSDEELAKINRGQTRLFHHTENWREEPNFQFYQRYDLLFRAYPLLPRRVQRLLRAEHVPEMHPRLANMIGFTVDLANALLRWDSDTLIYAKHYAHHLLRAARDLLPGRRARRPPVPATAPTGKRAPAVAAARA